MRLHQLVLTPISWAALAHAGGRRLQQQQKVLQEAGGLLPLLFAAGPQAPDGTIYQHYAYSSASLPMLAAPQTETSSATVSGDAIEGEIDEDDASLKAVSWPAGGCMLARCI